MDLCRLSRLSLLVLFAIPPVLHAAASTPLESARAVLRQGAEDSNPDVRREVAVALGLASKRDPIVSLLEKLAADKDHLVREAAMLSIGEVGDMRLVNSARKALDDDVPEVAFAAARALFKLNQPDGKQLLLDIVEKEAPARSSFARAKLRDAMRRMRRPKSAILFVVQQGIGFVPVPGIGAGYSALTSLVGDPDFSARATALMVLSSDRSPEVRKEIEAAFNDSDWSMRAAATQIAAFSQNRSLRFRLVPLFEDSNPRVRFRAAAAFLRLSGPAAPAQKRMRTSTPRQ